MNNTNTTHVDAARFTQTHVSKFRMNHFSGICFDFQSKAFEYELYDKLKSYIRTAYYIQRTCGRLRRVASYRLFSFSFLPTPFSSKSKTASNWQLNIPFPKQNRISIIGVSGPARTRTGDLRRVRATSYQTRLRALFNLREYSALGFEIRFSPS